jgi:hypothetical protein
LPPPDGLLWRATGLASAIRRRRWPRSVLALDPLPHPRTDRLLPAPAAENAAVAHAQLRAVGFHVGPDTRAQRLCGDSLAAAATVVRLALDREQCAVADGAAIDPAALAPQLNHGRGVAREHRVQGLRVKIGAQVAGRQVPDRDGGGAAGSLGLAPAQRRVQVGKALPMDLKGGYPNFKLGSRSRTDITRALAIEQACSVSDGGPFLMGQHGMADAMFAPAYCRCPCRSHGPPPRCERLKWRFDARVAARPASRGTQAPAGCRCGRRHQPISLSLAARLLPLSIAATRFSR